MIVGFVSDAHGNPTGLAGCLGALQRAGAERIYFLGDAVGYFPEENGALDLLRGAGATCVRGNHDAMLLGDLPLSPDRDRAYRIGEARTRIEPRHLEWLRQWPERLEVDLDGIRALLQHGSPGDPLEGYVYPDGDFSSFASLPFSLVAMGHTHRPLVAASGSVTLLNPGSSGMPRDVGDLASCAIWNSATRQAEVLRVRFDAAALLRKWGDQLHTSAAACLLRTPDAAPLGRIVPA